LSSVEPHTPVAPEDRTRSQLAGPVEPSMEDFAISICK
jgi:hypothetical protein